MVYISTKEASNNWDISERRIRGLCQEGRIEGAVKIGRNWAIPVDAHKPVDARQSEQKKYLSASSRIEQLTPINFEHFRSQTCSGDASYGSWLHSCERPPLDAEYGLG